MNNINIMLMLMMALICIIPRIIIELKGILNNIFNGAIFKLICFFIVYLQNGIIKLNQIIELFHVQVE